MATLNISRIDPRPGYGDYLTFAAWETATSYNLVAAGVRERAILASGAHEISATVNVGGATTDAECFREVWSEDGARFDPRGDTGSWFNCTTTGYPIIVKETGFQFVGVGFIWNGITHTAGYAMILTQLDTTNSNQLPLILDGCYFEARVVASTGTRAFRHYQGNFPFILRNCVFHATGDNTGNDGFVYTIQVDAGYGDDCIIDHCTVHGSAYHAVELGGDDAITISNTYVGNGHAVDIFFNAGSTNATFVNVVTSDTTANAPTNKTGSQISKTPNECFAFPSMRDYRVREDGPLFEAGSVSDTVDDYFGHSWGGGSPHVGAWKTVFDEFGRTQKLIAVDVPTMTAANVISHTVIAPNPYEREDKVTILMAVEAAATSYLLPECRLSPEAPWCRAPWGANTYQVASMDANGHKIVRGKRWPNMRMQSHANGDADYIHQCWIQV